MAELTEGKHAGEFIASEANGALSRLIMILISGMNLVAGAVLGKITKGAATPAADVGNTGDGAMGAVTLGTLAQVGDYLLECIAASANAGTFAVFAPDGSRLADLTVAVAYAGDHLNMTLADGAADFVVGDKFSVTVAAGSGKFTELDPTAVDGSQVAAGILYDNTDASAADADAVAIVRDAEVNGNEITWPTGFTADQITQGTAELEAVGILVRS